jgi:hypothetical protein
LQHLTDPMDETAQPGQNTKDQRSSSRRAESALVFHVTSPLFPIDSLFGLD